MIQTEPTSVRKSLFVLLALAGCVCICPTPGRAALNTVQAVAPLSSAEASRLSNAEAQTRKPVSFDATITYIRAYEKVIFVQDGQAAIFVFGSANVPLAAGDRIRVRGTMRPSFRPYVVSDEITLLHHGPMPEPIPATFDEMIRAETDCKQVTLRGRIESADLSFSRRFLTTTSALHMVVDGGPVDVTMDSNDVNALRGLLDAEVEVTGVVSGQFDNKMQQTGVLIHVQSLAKIKILKRATVDPWSLPVEPMDRLITGYRIRDLAQRMRIHGTVTYYQPEAAVVLQDGAKSMWVATQTHDPVRIGDVADAIGFPDVQNGFLMLTRSEVRDSAMPAPVVPPLLTWRDLASGGNSAKSHGFDLVSIDAQVVTEVRQATQDEYVLQTGGHLFSAFMRHPGPFNGGSIPAMKQVPIGARVRVTGICMLEDANPFNGDVPFNILMRSYDDIVVVARPPMLSVRNLIVLAGMLLLLVFAAGARSWVLERRVRHTTAAAAYVEHRRARILEEINNACPLNEILEQITQLVSYRLQGAPCWCQIGDGPAIGNQPAKTDSLRTVQEEIPAKSGTAHGAIFAAMDARIKPKASESEALAFAARLATLAIETSHLYSDLVHRSEFDLLTDIQNRFALEKSLDTLILHARLAAGAFGLIYVDLDGFKQINDRYGHHIGDFYLQCVAQRMKRQLRPGDTLARLGGDEFAALIPRVRSRGEAEEIAQRLERCFDQPFAAGGRMLNGSASVGIALFPQDADTKDSLLRAADAAMYVEKRTRHGVKQRPVIQL